MLPAVWECKRISRLQAVMCWCLETKFNNRVSRRTTDYWDAWWAHIPMPDTRWLHAKLNASFKWFVPISLVFWWGTWWPVGSKQLMSTPIFLRTQETGQKQWKLRACQGYIVSSRPALTTQLRCCTKLRSKKNRGLNIVIECLPSIVSP